MTLTREHGIWAIVAATLIAGTVWITRHTEWVDEQVRERPNLELRRDRDLRLKRLLGQLGVKVAAPTHLEQLPPPGATLVLSSRNWNLFPGREGALRRWVETGGNLVVADFAFERGGFDWVPVVAKREKPAAAEAAASAASPAGSEIPDERDEDAEHDEDDVSEAKPPGRPQLGAQPSQPRCPGLNEPAEVTPAFGFARGYSTCMFATGDPLRASVPPSWALDGARGHVVVRVPVGRGSTTVSRGSLPFDNDALPDHDNALIAVAVLRARPGREVWLVRDEARPPLLEFLWTRGAPAVLLGAAALGFALWRGARRFGPRIASLPLARRSMAEQIRGTANFISSRGSAALHAAQVRALNESAAPRIRGFDTMTLGQRAQAIATLTGIDPHTLAHAMNSALNATPSRHPAAALALIETARRRLLHAVRPPKHATESR